MTSRCLCALLFFTLPGLLACDGETGAPCGDTTCASGEQCCDPCFGQPLYCAEGCPRVLCEDGGEPADAGGRDEDAGPLETDAGPNDAGDGSDAGPGTDGGAETDAGVGTDAGPLDGGASGGECVAQDVRGEGDCDLAFGPFFLGSSCGDVSGCSCVGADCGATYESAADCERLERGCVLGCGAQDAVGVGPCEAIVGTFWDGSACVTRSGCSCRGDDCVNAYDESGECESAHRACG